MLIRIAPDMFTDERFECVTLSDVRNELFRTQKFKIRYPWRNKYKGKIVSLPESKLSANEYSLYYNAIKAMISGGIVNYSTGRLFNLSNIDRKITAFALAHGYKISSVDAAIIQFADQEFTDSFAGYISPLELINTWIKKKLIAWGDTKQAYLEEWHRLEEPRQPKKEARKFTKLTGYDYVGS